MDDKLLEKWKAHETNIVKSGLGTGLKMILIVRSIIRQKDNPKITFAVIDTN